MHFHFEDPFADERVAYQRDAITAVTDLFRGQETCRTEFTVTRRPAAALAAQGALGLDEESLGYGNRLQLLDDELHANLRAVQLRNGLAPAASLAGRDFTVEMETGTGKTYVYLRTIHELHRVYGFTKFVIVVPSVAIKEGVYKTLEMTRDHFRALYAGTQAEFFLYDSSKLGQVRSFATSATLQVMVTTVGAINKTDANVFYQPREQTGGLKPVELVAATRPIVVIDEPQSVDGGLNGAGRRALEQMKPLCTLRYSATHRDLHHLVYSLGPVDAYQKELVKQIEVAALTVDGAYNTPYVLLKKVKHRPRMEATVDLYVRGAHGVAVVEKKVRPGDDLEQTTKNPLYRDVQIGEMDATPGAQAMEVRGPGFDVTLRLGADARPAYGGVDADGFARLMIRRTIREHLEKERRLRPLGIKVLSLFFVDAVEHYRRYAPDGTAEPGKYARIFEEEYAREVADRKWTELFDAANPAPHAADVHDGYFSQDRNRRWTDTAEGNATGREAAERAYALIMRDKERLLSLGEPLRFIFSHSALREGWDNPNVFQICALREMGSETERRQTIGRGLRLCVDQRGVRRRGFELNTLTVVAGESYETFAAGLQQELERDGIRFGVVERHTFANVPLAPDAPTGATLGAEHSETLWRHLHEAGYVDGAGRVQDALRTALRTGTLSLPAGFEAQRAAIAERLRRASGRLEVRNADERVTIGVRQAVLDRPEFRELWERIQQRTTYRVEFDNARLVADCTEAIRDMPPVATPRVTVRTATLAVDEAGVRPGDRVKESAPMVIAERDVELPDVLTVLQDATQLTRRSLARMLVDSGRLDDFRKNPQQFITFAAEAINRRKQRVLVDGVRYRRLGEHDVYAQELFQARELTAYLKNTVASTKSPYERVVYDSAGVERGFAEALEANEAVKVYAKLPGWFTVPTPLGSYNPDWAIVVDDAAGERLYLVVETKGGLFTDDLRERERAKVACGIEHFKAIGAAVTERPAEFRIARTLDDVLAPA